MAWLDMQVNARKSCMVRCRPRHNKECADILLNGVPLNRGKTFKYLGILFEVGRKLKVSLAAKRMKFFRAYNYIYGCVGATASPMVLCHLLNTFCLPILLYQLEAVPLSHANFTTLQSTWRVALYKIFRVHDVNNLLYIQSCMSILLITFAVDLRKLVFLHKLSVNVMSTVHTVFLSLLLKNMNSYMRSTALRKDIYGHVYAVA